MGSGEAQAPRGDFSVAPQGRQLDQIRHELPALIRGQHLVRVIRQKCKRLVAGQLGKHWFSRQQSPSALNVRSCARGRSVRHEDRVLGGIEEVRDGRSGARGTWAPGPICHGGSVALRAQVGDERGDGLALILGEVVRVERVVEGAVRQDRLVRGHHVAG